MLLSDHFYYFGDRPQHLPDDLLGIVKQGQGHRSVSNAPFAEAFMTWIEGLGFKANVLHGEPQLDLFQNEAAVVTCAAERKTEALEEWGGNSHRSPIGAMTHSTRNGGDRPTLATA